jgi:hypothetical protein
MLPKFEQNPSNDGKTAKILGFEAVCLCYTLGRDEPSMRHREVLSI